MNTETKEAPMEVIQPSAVEAISKAEINQAIATAKQYPRNMHKVKQSMITLATLDEETAQACFYTLPRGGKNIQGPSVRLAEIAVSCYGNVRVGTRIIATDTASENPHVVVQAVAMDLENNVSVSIEKRRRITAKKDFKTGGRKPIDDDDINLAVNACSSIAKRDAVYNIVPLALVKPAYEAARKAAVGDAKTIVDRRAKCVEMFAKMGITKERLLAKIEKKSVDEIGLEELEILIGLFNAVRDGETPIDEAFPAPAKSTAANLSDIKAGAPSNVVPMHQNAPANAAKAPQEAPKSDAGVSEPQKEGESPVEGTQQAASGPISDGQTTTEPAKEPEQPADDPLAEGKKALGDLSGLMEQHQITIKQVLAFTEKNHISKKGQPLTELSTIKLKNLIKAISNPDGKVLGEIRKFAA